MRLFTPTAILSILLTSLGIAAPSTNVGAPCASGASLQALELGFVPDTGTDSTEVARRVVAELKKRKIGRLALAPGRYDFGNDAADERQPIFNFTSVDGLEIDGQGSRLVFAGKVSPFAFNHCRNVILRNLTIDWDRPLFSQGTVLRSTDHGLEVRVDAAYLANRDKVIEGLMDYDPVTLLPTGNFDMFRDYIVSKEWISDDVLRLGFDVEKHDAKTEYVRKALPLVKGRRLILRHTVYGNYGVDFFGCDNVAMKDVSIYHVPGMAVHAQQTNNVTLENVQVRNKPGSGRLMSNTADCIFITHCTGAITITDCYFEGNGDDGLNITGAKYGKLASKDDRRIEVDPPAGVWRGPTPSPGDVLEFAGGRDLVTTCTIPVSRAEWDSQSKRFIIVLERPVPDSVQLGDFVVSRRYCASGRITGTTFRGQRSRGIVLSTDDVLIENCRFEGMPEPAIMLKGGNRHHREAPVCHGVVVRDNVFERVGGPALQASAGAPDPGQDVVRDVVFEGNTVRTDAAFKALRVFHQFSQWAYLDSALSLASINGLVVRNNTIEGPYATAILLDRVRQATVTDNRSSQPNRIVVDSDTCTDVGIGDNSGLVLIPNREVGLKSQPMRLNDLR